MWEFGDGQTVTGANVAHVYKFPGKYNVKLTVTDASGTITASRSKEVPLTVNAPPVADAGADQVVSAGENVIFDGSFCRDPDDGIVSYRT